MKTAITQRLSSVGSTNNGQRKYKKQRLSSPKAAPSVFKRDTKPTKQTINTIDLDVSNRHHYLSWANSLPGDNDVILKQLASLQLPAGSDPPDDYSLLVPLALRNYSDSQLKLILRESGFVDEHFDEHGSPGPFYNRKRLIDTAARIIFDNWNKLPFEQTRSAVTGGNESSVISLSPVKKNKRARVKVTKRVAGEVPVLSR